ncbi:hypothetical protein LX36DRAFT_657338 [Colletotrichum falcatum]|nr:hypothetical protein LX36DRAFT_657338 [Colletotrichum falcatum]
MKLLSMLLVLLLCNTLPYYQYPHMPLFFLADRACIRRIWTTSSEVELSWATPELALLTRYLSSSGRLRNST